ncbi:MAG: YhcH/YjgK/YiaL family protein [Elusimicrobia bacterium CG_4_10_14_0_2_um_filter_56_8]|nr:MAG: hypothetical protein AUJ51_07025 [Elusimicrobia bacterium CG1_02_56_21]PJA17304.1 MAG: YhcH/YjgK/YiaL family protein [Elusimicrobia bacterium CG_4_10_14_0_2_um_filter_56_8]
MIIIDLENAEFRISPRGPLGKALEFLRRPGLENLPDGKYGIDGERVFAMVQRYETIALPEPRFEAHRKYIDVQYVAAGAEIIGCAPLPVMAVSEVYDEEKDICFGAVPGGSWTPLLLEAGGLAVLYPEDAHAPRLAAGAPGAVIKIVVKVASRF